MIMFLARGAEASVPRNSDKLLPRPPASTYISYRLDPARFGLRDHRRLRPHHPQLRQQHRPLALFSPLHAPDGTNHAATATALADQFFANPQFLRLHRL